VRTIRPPHRWAAAWRLRASRYQVGFRDDRWTSGERGGAGQQSAGDEIAGAVSRGHVPGGPPDPRQWRRQRDPEATGEGCAERVEAARQLGEQLLVAVGRGRDRRNGSGS
jgi:hypothetical protein